MKSGRTIKNKKASSTTNKKVKNATVVIYDGITFRSKLEVYTYKKLKEYKIKAKYEPVSFTLVEPFSYGNKKIRAMTYTPDFVGKDFIIECKGMPNESFPLRWKLFQLYLHNNNLNYDLYIPHNHKEVDEVIKQIKEKNDRAQEGSETIQTKRRFKFFSFLV